MSVLEKDVACASTLEIQISRPPGDKGKGAGAERRGTSWCAST